MKFFIKLSLLLYFFVLDLILLWCFSVTQSDPIAEQSKEQIYGQQSEKGATKSVRGQREKSGSPGCKLDGGSLRGSP